MWLAVLTIMWKIILFLLPIILSVSFKIMQNIIKAVDAAEQNQDLTGTQKRELVMTQVKTELDFSKTSFPLWVLNLLLEASVGYVKTTTVAAAK
jgi:hypothetical protein